MKNYSSHGGTGRTDGKVPDVYNTEFNTSVKSQGLLGYTDTTIDVTNIHVDTFTTPGTYIIYNPTLEMGYPLVGAYQYRMQVQKCGKDKRIHQVVSDGIGYGSYGRVMYYDGTSQSYKVKSNWVGSYDREFTAGTIWISKDGDDHNTGSRKDSPILTVNELMKRLANTYNVGTYSIRFGAGEWGNVTFDGRFISAKSIIIAQDEVQVADTNDYSNFPIFDHLVFCNGLANTGLRNIYARRLTVTHGTELYVDNYMNIFGSLSVVGNSFYNSIGKTVFTSDALLSNYVMQVDTGSSCYFYDTAQFAFKEPITRDYFLVLGSNAVANLTGIDLSGLNFMGAKLRAIESATLYTTSIPGTGDNGRCIQSLRVGTIHSSSLDSTTFIPNTDNAILLGKADHRWKEVFSATGNINTSDERVKEDIESIPEKVFEAWEEVNFSQFKFKDAVQEKGDKARKHTGLIAQHILRVFQNHNLDATEYGLLCHDSWEGYENDEKVIDQEAAYETVRVVDKEESETGPEEFHFEEREIRPEISHIVHHSKPAGDRYSLRYDECLCLEAAYQRWKNQKLENRIAALEAKLS